MPDALPEKDKWVGDRAAVQVHLGMIQAIITRMATSSASCKTWCLALVGAVTSLAGATHQPAVLGYCAVVVAIFGYMDVCYLAQEKAFRGHFEAIVEKIQGDRYLAVDAFALKAKAVRADFDHALKSWSIVPVYGGLLLAYLVAWLLGWTALLATH